MKKPTPIVREDQLNNLHYLLTKWMNTNELNFPYRNCLNCEHWDTNNDICGKFKSLPPPKVIAFSCEHYKDIEGIPF